METTPLIQDDENIRKYKFYLYINLLFIPVLILLLTYNILISEHTFQNNTYENTCNCFNTSGWNLMNDTTCCLFEVPTYCRNSTVLETSTINPPVKDYLYFPLSYILVIINFYLVLQHQKYSVKVYRPSLYDFEYNCRYNITIYSNGILIVVIFIYNFILLDRYNRVSTTCL